MQAGKAKPRASELSWSGHQSAGEKSNQGLKFLRPYSDTVLSQYSYDETSDFKSTEAVSLGAVATGISFDLEAAQLGSRRHHWPMGVLLCRGRGAGGGGRQGGAMNQRRLSITAHLALLSWLMTLVTLGAFVLAVLPEEKRIVLGNMQAKAGEIARSLRNVASAPAAKDGYHRLRLLCLQILNSDKSIEYLTLTRSDGFTLIQDRNKPPTSAVLPESWHPALRRPAAAIETAPYFNRRVLDYTLPLDAAETPWGWVHVGLSLENYDRSASIINYRTCILAIFCAGISLPVCMVGARKLFRPVLRSGNIPRKGADRFYSPSARVHRSDEMHVLCATVNAMTEALVKPATLLQSVANGDGSGKEARVHSEVPMTGERTDT